MPVLRHASQAGPMRSVQCVVARLITTVSLTGNVLRMVLAHALAIASSGLIIVSGASTANHAPRSTAGCYHLANSTPLPIIILNVS